MSLFSFLFGKKKKEPEVLRFVRALCEEHDPRICGEWYGGRYRFTLNYPDHIEVQFEYDTYRGTWGEFRVWQYQTGFLYYTDCLSFQPVGTINYLRERFGLNERLALAVAAKKEKDDKRQLLANE